MHFNAFSNAFGPRFQSLWSRIFQLKRNKNKLKTQENLFKTISTPLWVSSGGGTMFNVCINAKIIPDTDIPAIVVFFVLLFFIFFIIFFLFFYIFVPRLFEEKRRDIVFGIPSFRPSVLPSVLPSFRPSVPLI